MKKLFKKIWAFIAGLFAGLAPVLKNAIDIGAAVTEKIKDFDTASPYVGDIITSLIPGTVDDLIKEKLREYLPKIAVQLRLVQATHGLRDPDQIMLAAVKVIQQMDKDYKSAFLHSFSIMVSKVAADGKLDWSDAVYLMEWYYQNKVKEGK